MIENKTFTSPYVARIFSIWEHFRPLIVDNFPEPPGLPDLKTYLHTIDKNYTQDAYNSLSIEGYKVTNELIEKVRKKEWNPDTNLEDEPQHNALSARGYYEAFLLVKESIGHIIQGKSPGHVVKKDLPRWYQKLFSPFVNIGLLSPQDIYGYRKHQVYIRNSRHTPPSKEHLPDIMEALFTLLEQEEHAGVRAILGHFIFVYIHPYMDGNGRIGRFLMNSMLASGGYPWTIISVSHRDEYLESLESASVHENILPFTQFIKNEMKYF